MDRTLYLALVSSFDAEMPNRRLNMIMVAFTEDQVAAERAIRAAANRECEVVFTDHSLPAVEIVARYGLEHGQATHL